MPARLASGSSEITNTKTFGGKTFYLSGGYDSAKAAQAKAAKVRANGYSARVIKSVSIHPKQDWGKYLPGREGRYERWVIYTRPALPRTGYLRR